MNNGQKIARRTKAKHLIYTSAIGKTTWPTGVIKIESSCTIGGSNCVQNETARWSAVLPEMKRRW
jgi:hypothetical protein